LVDVGFEAGNTNQRNGTTNNASRFFPYSMAKVDSKAMNDFASGVPLRGTA